MKKMKYKRLKRTLIKSKQKKCKYIDFFLKYIYFYISTLFIFIYLLKNYSYFYKSKNESVNNNFSSKSKVCLCSIGKKENLYAKEFVTHYKNLGYDHIFIYDNNDIGDEKINDVLEEELKSGFVSIVDIRGKEGNDVNSPQCYAFIDCYEKNNKNYDWLSFFDFDEFLDISPYSSNIKEFLESKRYENCAVIKINFLFYSDSELLHYDNRPLQERFTTPLWRHGSNGVCKVTVRGGLSQNYWSIGCSPHTSKVKCKNCNASGKPISYKTLGNSPPAFKYARIKHYYTKTVEEYINKSKRGSAYTIVKWNKARKKMKMNLFFLYNKRTKEKVELLKQLFELT